MKLGRPKDDQRRGGKETGAPPRNSARKQQPIRYGSYYHSSQRPIEQRVVQRMSGKNSGRGEAQHMREKLLRATLQRRRLALLGIVLVCCLALGSFLHLSTLVTVEFAGSTQSDALLLHSKQNYADAASKFISESFLNRNKLTIDTSGIAERMKVEFPELRAVQLEVPLLGFSPRLIIDPSPPTAILQPTSGPTVVVDSSGYVVGDVSLLRAATLPIIVDQSGMKPLQGTQALPSTTMDFIGQLIAQLKAHNIKAESLVLPAGSADEIDLRTSGLSYYTKFAVHDPSTFSQQIGSYLTLIDYLKRHHSTPSEYIDVRLPGRAYYK